ncbi:hypothetical protein ACQEVS_20735 [Streptomyces sp. CA-181903]|uniref:hypothetical protein n=1 Tax=Streptomyces sp. CA-181903 TaxID=3240055 RepID=UPI003D8FBEED
MADDHEHDWLRHDDRLDGTALASCAACDSCASCASRTPPLDPEQADAALAALRALAAPDPESGGPLPGEDAAVAAFLAARRAEPAERALDEAALTPSPPVVIGSGPGADEGETREPRGGWTRAGRTGRDGARGGGTGPRGRSTDRAGRHGTRSLPHRRPARAVLAAALAACALSGIAVLSGIVAVPTPFTAAGHGPAAVGDRAGTVGGDGPHTARPSPSRSASPGPADGRAEGGRDGKGADGHLLPPPAGPSPSGHGTPRPGERSSAGPGAGGDEETASPYRGDADGDTEQAVGLCRDYLTRGKWREQADEDAVHALERRAGGPSGVRAYCTRLVHDHDQVAGEGDGSAGGDGGDGENEDDKGDGGDGGDEEGDRGSVDDSAHQAGDI